MALLFRDLRRLLAQRSPGPLGQMRDRAFLFCGSRRLLDVLASSAPLFFARHGVLLT